MQSIHTSEDLKAAIHALEGKQAIEWLLLKDQINSTRDSLQPLNLLKNSLRDVISKPILNDNLTGTALGLTAGYLSKIVLAGITHGPIKAIMGALLQLRITNVVENNSGTITHSLGNLFSYLTKKKAEKE